MLLLVAPLIESKIFLDYSRILSRNSFRLENLDISGETHNFSVVFSMKFCEEASGFLTSFPSVQHDKTYFTDENVLFSDENTNFLIAIRLFDKLF